MLEGDAARDCSILYTLAFRLNFGAIVGEWYFSGDTAG